MQRVVSSRFVIEALRTEEEAKMLHHLPSLRAAAMSAKQTVQVVAPPEPPTGAGTVSGAFLAYFPSGAPAGVAGSGVAAGGAAGKPAAAAARPPNTRFSVYRRNTAVQTRQQLMLVGHTVRPRRRATPRRLLATQRALLPAHALHPCDRARPQEAVDYVGTNFGGDAAAAAPCQYALGVVDAAAGTVSFVPVAGAKVLRMDATVRGLDYGAPEWQQDEAAETPAGRAAARKRLDDSAFPVRLAVLRCCGGRALRCVALTPRAAAHPATAQRSPRRSGGGRRRGCRRRAWWRRTRCQP
jgi:hypothetical protein